MRMPKSIQTISNVVGIRTVRTRTTIVATTAVAVALVLAMTGFIFAIESTLTKQVRAQGELEVDEVSERLLSGSSPRESLELTSDNQSGTPTFVAILDSNGGPLAGGGEISNLAGNEGDRAVDIRSLPDNRVEVVIEGSRLSIAQRPVNIDGRVLIVVAVSPLGDVVNNIETIIGYGFIGVPFLVLVVGFATWFATGRTLRPIETMRTEVETLSGKTLNTRVKVPASRDEVSRLAKTMNIMLTKLEKASLRQQEFVSDASHELRSPVASIKTELEVSLSYPEETNWPVTARNILKETNRLEKIVRDLLLLAQFDEGLVRAPVEIDISNILKQIVESNEVAQKIVVKTNIANELQIHGNQNALTSIFRNLFENATRHARSSVTVSAIHETHDSIKVTIEDDGSGIPPQDRYRIFERFTRLDSPRSRHDGGIGLGLSIVDRGVRQHQGNVIVSDSYLGGAKFEVGLPIKVRQPDNNV